MTKLTNDQVSKLLDSSTEHKGFHSISKACGISQSTVMKYMQDNPLWNWFRLQNDHGNKARTED